MASDDDTDFSTRIQVLDDNNAELLRIGLTQKHTLMILIGMLAIFFIVLIAVNGISSKDISSLTKDIVKVVDIVGRNRTN